MHLNLLEAKLQKYQTGELQALMAYTDSSFKNSLLWQTGYQNE